MEVGSSLSSFINRKTWEKPLTKELSPYDYVLVDSMFNVAMNVFVFVQNDHKENTLANDQIEEPLNALVFTHKAGQSIRILFYGTVLTFTNSHFSAGESKTNLDDRIKDVEKVLRKKFGNEESLNNKGSNNYSESILNTYFKLIY